MGWVGRRAPAAVVVVTALLAGSPAAGAAGWTTVFEDTFDGGRLDRSRWATRFIYENEELDHLRDEVQIYRDNSNHLVTDGRLDLVARKFGTRYESGMIRSRQTFYYGYFEARVRLPSGTGIWPSFWLNSDYDLDGLLTWPPEIDIFQFPVNGVEDTEYQIFSSAAQTPGGALGEFLHADGSFDQTHQVYRSDTPLNDDWRVVGLVWTPDTISAFLDGKRLYTRKYQWTDVAGNLAPPAHVILNFALGGSWAGRHGIDDDFPKTFAIDHVRVCQIARDGGGDRLCGGSEFTPDPAEFGYEAPMDDMARPGFRCIDIQPGGPGCIGELSWKEEFELASELRIPEGGLGPRFVVTRLQSVARPSLSVVVGTREIAAETGAATNLLKDRMVVPANLAPGDYAIVQSLAVPDPNRPDGLGLPTPLSCTEGMKAEPKTLRCQIGEVRVLRR